MRRLVGSGLLLLFAFALAGVYPAQWSLRNQARREMRAIIRACSGRIDGVAVITLPLVNGRVNDERFAWEEADEFSFDGAMYDVVLQEVKGDVVVFHCVADAREDALIAHAQRVDPFHAHDRSAPAPVLKFIGDQFLAPQHGGLTAASFLLGTATTSGTQEVLNGHGRAPFRPPAV